VSYVQAPQDLGVDMSWLRDWVKLIRKLNATDAAVHDSQKLDDVLDFSNTGKGVWADGAYRSVQIEASLKAKACRVISTGAPHEIVRCRSARIREHDALDRQPGIKTAPDRGLTWVRAGTRSLG
jgi:IS5 family transposase